MKNCDIVINLHEISSTVHQEFEITATRKKLTRLEQISAFNVAKQLSCRSDTKELPLPKPMKKLINLYIDTFSVELIMNVIVTKYICQYLLHLFHLTVN